MRDHPAVSTSLHRPSILFRPHHKDTIPKAYAILISNPSNVVNPIRVKAIAIGKYIISFFVLSLVQQVLMLCPYGGVVGYRPQVRSDFKLLQQLQSYLAIIH